MDEADFVVQQGVQHHAAYTGTYLSPSSLLTPAAFIFFQPARISPTYTNSMAISLLHWAIVCTK